MELIDRTHLLLVAIALLVVIRPRGLPEPARACRRAPRRELREALGDGIDGEVPDRALGGRDARWRVPEHWHG